MNWLKKKEGTNIEIFSWFLVLTILVFLMILIGGLTRLTESGLSIVDWKPFMGSIPPLNKADWIELFNAYKQSPEFIIVNYYISLNEFKYIFWWEWAHRFFARIIGLALIIPMIIFFLQKKLSKKLLGRLIILFIFVMIQSIVGWWMVKSGLNDNPYVSPYRLAFHLTNAIIILSILFWTMLDSWSNINTKFFPKGNLEVSIYILIGLLFITIISGAFMAGSNAGQSFNTYPLMNDKFFPDGYFSDHFIFRNFFENTIAINFNHRWLATLTFVLIILFAFYLKISKKITRSGIGSNLIIVFAILQFLLGIFTLLTNVKIAIASMHQINSVLLLCSLLFVYYSIKKERL